MSRLSKNVKILLLCGVIILIIGAHTIAIVMFLALFADIWAPPIFILTGFFCWIFGAIIVFIIPDKYYHIVNLKNFPLKLEFTLVVLYSLFIGFVFYLNMDIARYRVTGEDPRLIPIFIILILIGLGAFTIRCIFKQKSNKK